MAESGSPIPFYQRVLTRTEVANSVANGVFYVAVGNRAAVADGAFVDVGIDTGPATGTPTVLTQLDVIMKSASITITMYEGSDWTGSDEIPSTNLNRLASAAGLDALRETTLERDPSITDIGTPILSWEVIGITAAGNNDIVTANIEIPVVLVPGMQYLIRVTNTGGQTADAAAALQFIDRTVN